MAAVSLFFNQKISDVSDQLNMICTSFQEGSADSSKIKQMFNSFVDRVHRDYGFVFEHAVYYNLWRIKKEPIGDLEYGRNCFHDIGELCSSAQEKVDAIRIVYLQINAYLTHPNLLSDLRRVSSLYKDTKLDDAKALFIQITDNAECRVIRDLCCYNLWKLQGKPEECPTFGEDCFMDKIPTKTSKKVKAIGLLFKDDAVVAYLERSNAFASPSAVDKGNLIHEGGLQKSVLSEQKTIPPTNVLEKQLISNPKNFDEMEGACSTDYLEGLKKESLSVKLVGLFLFPFLLPIFLPLDMTVIVLNNVAQNNGDKEKNKPQ